MDKIKISTLNNPRILVIDNFFPNLPELHELAKTCYPWSKGRNTCLSLMEPRIKDQTLFTKTLAYKITYEFWNDDKLKLYDTLPQPFTLLNALRISNMELGFFQTGDKKTWQNEEKFLTAHIFLHTKKTFAGGDLVIKNTVNTHNCKDIKVERIEAKPNRLVIAPSCYKMSTNPIVTSKDLNGKMCIVSYFLGF